MSGLVKQSIFTKAFGVINAKNFESELTAGFANTYVAFGRNRTWDNGDTTPTPTDTANSFYEFWNNIIGIKKITASDMNLVIPRVDWAANTIYTEYGQDVELFTKANTANVKYDKSFYVRNVRDQVFKCLYNGFSNTSTVMPEITIDGQLPENAYVSTGDGYRWKYMYTIPAGLKEKFLTSEFMPVVSEDIVTGSAVDGRLDIIEVITAGAGYNANANSNSIAIFTVSGDGSGANLTARVSSTSANGANIIGVNILSGGNGYTRAAITISDPVKIALTANANVIAVIGPPGGHGSSVETELGASNLMISVNLEGDEGGVFPVSTLETTGFRQLGIVKDPLHANNSYASGNIYNCTAKYVLTAPNKSFIHNEVVYVGESLDTATFVGNVQHYDDAFYYVYLTNRSGSVSIPATLIGQTSGALATILSVTEPDIKKNSGELLYIENSAQIVRVLDETQQMKLTLRF